MAGSWSKLESRIELAIVILVYDALNFFFGQALKQSSSTLAGVPWVGCIDDFVNVVHSVPIRIECFNLFKFPPSIFIILAIGIELVTIGMAKDTRSNFTYRSWVRFLETLKVPHFGIYGE